MEDINNSQTCSVTGYKDCSLPKYKDYDECILHCSKEDTVKDYHMSFEERDLFKEKFIEHIVDILFEHTEETTTRNKKGIKEYLEAEEAEADEAYDEFLKSKIIVLNHISFPNQDSRDDSDYTFLLNKLGKVHFNYCKFYVKWIKLENVEVFFQDCEFYDDWYLEDYALLENQSNVIYQKCTFHKNVSASGSENEAEENEDETGEDKRKKRPSLTKIQFSNCSFLERLSFEYVDIMASLFNNHDEIPSKIKYLKLYYTNIKKRFILNNCSIDSVYMKNCVFEDKYEFKNNTINIFEIDNCNFKSLADFFGTSFDSFSIYKSIFDDFTGFEDCTFGTDKKVKEKEDIAKFEYVTFINKINFRHATFHAGLDMSHANFTEDPNFLDAEIDPTYTTRETFRGIKHSLDKVGNHIDANKYFVLEMKSYKKEMEQQNEKRKNQAWIVFWFNDKISDFGQNYYRPIIMLFISAAIFSFLHYGYKQNWLYKMMPEYNSYIEGFANFFNGWAHGYLPFSKFFVEGMEFISLLFYIINLVLIWQIVVAVKRHTKR